ncbi:MAG TPA: type II secretion system minor pseudopilin GspH [Steroidobacteraceae bacterium]|nr:type II secretion system minor pseudopilin GspH [Steroidobacteraceae bacterium]
MQCATRFAAARRRVAGRPGHSPSGFTLLELLVVIVIVGIMVALASVSINVLGRDNQVEDQAKRLNAVIGQVREESEMQARDVGLFIERDGYLFMRYNYLAQSWYEISDDEMLAYHPLPKGLQNRLWLEGREVILKSHDENTKAATHALEGSSASAAATGSNADAAATLQKDPRVPQIAILSSGDISPFELRIEREGTDFSWHLVAKADNSVTVEATDAQK